MKGLIFAAPLVLAGAGITCFGTTLVFNEIMYHPATNGPAMEWVELYDQS